MGGLTVGRINQISVNFLHEGTQSQPTTPDALQPENPVRPNYRRIMRLWTSLLPDRSRRLLGVSMNLLQPPNCNLWLFMRFLHRSLPVSVWIIINTSRRLFSHQSPSISGSSPYQRAFRITDSSRTVTVRLQRSTTLPRELKNPPTASFSPPHVLVAPIAVTHLATMHQRDEPLYV